MDSNTLLAAINLINRADIKASEADAVVEIRRRLSAWAQMLQEAEKQQAEKEEE